MSSLLGSMIALSSVDIVSLISMVFFHLANIFKQYKITGIAIPSKEIAYALKHLQSQDVVFVNLDEQVSQGGFTNNSKNCSLEIDRDFYNRALLVSDDIKSIIQKTSKSCKNIVFFSNDYKLLKFLQIGKIFYFLPSQACIDNQQLTDDDKDKYQAFKDKLISGKKTDKAKIYNTFDEALGVLAKMYDCQQKI